MIRIGRRIAVALAALGLLTGSLGALPVAAADNDTAVVKQKVKCTGGTKKLTIDDVDDPSDVDFSGSVQFTTASFLLEAGHTPGCTADGWKVTLLATGSGAITASNVATVSVPNPTLVEGQPTLPTTGANPNGPLNTARTVMSAALNTGNGLYAQTIPLKLTIPAYSAPGDYTITVTATIITGP